LEEILQPGKDGTDFSIPDGHNWLLLKQGSVTVADQTGCVFQVVFVERDDLKGHAVMIIEEEILGKRPKPVQRLENLGAVAKPDL
jgi:hypothetical protein